MTWVEFLNEHIVVICVTAVAVAFWLGPWPPSKR